MSNKNKVMNIKIDKKEKNWQMDTNNGVEEKTSRTRDSIV